MINYFLHNHVKFEGSFGSSISFLISRNADGAIMSLCSMVISSLREDFIFLFSIVVITLRESLHMIKAPTLSWFDIHFRDLITAMLLTL